MHVLLLYCYTIINKLQLMIIIVSLFIYPCHLFNAAKIFIVSSDQHQHHRQI